MGGVQVSRLPGHARATHPLVGPRNPRTSSAGLERGVRAWMMQAHTAFLAGIAAFSWASKTSLTRRDSERIVARFVCPSRPCHEKNARILIVLTFPPIFAISVPLIR